MSPPANADTEPLVPLESGTAKDWAVIQPTEPRKSKLFCQFLPCALCLAPAIMFLGFFPLMFGIGLVMTLYYVFCCPGAVVSIWLMSWQWAVDLYCKLLYLSYQQMLLSWKKPVASEDMPIDKLVPKRKLEKGYVDYALNLQVPHSYEEEFKGMEEAKGKGTLFWISELMAKVLYKTDRFDAFGPDEDPVKYVMDRLDSVYPPVYQEWNDKQSDMALARFCLHGLGAHRVEATEVDGQRLFVVRCNALAGLPVRKGFARYGGDAYFDSAWKPVKIVDLGYKQEVADDGRETPTVIRPGDPRWEEAKFRFRSSLSVLVTLVDHLFGSHMQAANLMVTAVRECLDTDHPLRRFLTPFTYETISVNSNARQNLVAPKSMSSRCFAFSEQGLQMAFAGAPKLIQAGTEVPRSEGGPLFNREKYAEWKKKQGVDTEYWRQSTKFWHVVRRFVVRYLDYYYDTHADVARDKAIADMIRQIVHQMHIVSPSDLGHQEEEDYMDNDGSPEKAEKVYEMIVDVISNLIVTCTAIHEQVGAVEAYVQDVAFCAFKWVPGALIGTKQTALAQAILMSFTSTPMLKLLGEDWTHLFIERPAPAQGALNPSQCFKYFQQDLRELAQQCDAYNEQADKRSFPENYPMYVFNPKLLETSISV